MLMLRFPMNGRNKLSKKDQKQKLGNEFRSTTGRPRRCGWIDLVALKFACMINGVTKIIMTKADILDSLESLQVCNSYRINGKTVEQIPFQMIKMDIEPNYQEFVGWKTDTTQISKFDTLPEKMKIYINYLNSNLGVPVKYISNGPGSDQLIVAP